MINTTTRTSNPVVSHALVFVFGLLLGAFLFSSFHTCPAQPAPVIQPFPVVLPSIPVIQPATSASVIEIPAATSPAIVQSVPAVQPATPVIQIVEKIVERIVTVEKPVIVTKIVEKQVIVQVIKEVQVPPPDQPDPKISEFLRERAKIFSRPNGICNSWIVTRLQNGETIHDAVRRVNGDLVTTFKMYIRNGIRPSMWDTVIIKRICRCP